MEVDEPNITPQKKRGRREGSRKIKRVDLKGVGAGTSIAPIGRYPHLFNDKYTVKLTYADVINHTIDYTTESQLFRPFSIFDPDYTNVGHQPFARDLWSSIYGYYCVVEAHAKFHFVNCYSDTVIYTAAGTSSQNVGQICASVTHSTTETDFGGDFPSPLLEQKNQISMLLISNTDQKHWNFSKKYTQDDFQVDAKEQNADNVWTAVGSNPSINRFVGYSIAPVQQAAETGQNETLSIHVQVLVQIDMVVQFSQVAASYRYTTS